MKRRDFLATAGKSTAGAFLAGNEIIRGAEALAHAAAPAKPNIILILVDDLGYNDLGIQGCTDIPTPHMDSIGRNGIRFTQGYVSCPLCAPTRAGLMTGRYQQRFGFEHNPGPENQAGDDFGLPLTESTLAERLKKLGYATGMIGKWHLGFKAEFQPTKRGFDEFFGFLSGAHPYMPGKTGAQNPILRGSAPVEEKEYLTDAFAREAVAFIDRHRSNPFFLYLPFNAVHTPLEATEKYLARFKNIQDSKRRTHAAMLSALDDAVGAVLSRVRAAGLEEKTLIILLGDNGGPTQQTTSSNTPLRGFKAQVLEGGIRIPFLMQWKNRIPAGKVETRPVISLDIHPTAVAAAGATIDPAWKLDGTNLLPNLTEGKSGMPHETLFWRMEPQWAVRHGDLKLVSTGAEKEALFDLSGDPGESKNLSVERPEDVKKLKSLFDEWNSQLQASKWQRRRATAAAPRQLLNPNANLGPAQVQRQFNALDTNKDGKLTPGEFARPQVFRRMDADGDGILTLEEVRKFFTRRRP
jgi:arylsulfatase A-like enzyme